MKKLAILGIVALIVGTAYSPLQAQQVVQGTVTSAEDGEPLPGVSILLKGTTTGTISDIEGKYSLEIPFSDATLVFTYIGYKTVNEAIGARSTIDVILEVQVLALEEVVVSGVGVTRERRSLGYAVGEVDNDEILNAQESNLTKALSGKVPGVVVQSNAGVPGAAAQIRIRGATSVTGSNDPLYVIDGVPIDNSTNRAPGTFATGGIDASNRAIDINPDDIANISILKGGAATALYGIRGANGVVLITTKKGSNASRIKLTLNSSVTVSEQNGITPLQDEFAQGSASAYRPPAPGNSTSWGPHISQLVWVSSEENKWDRNGAVMLRSEAEADGLAFRSAQAYDNVGDFYKRGVGSSHTLSLSGGTQRAEYYVSAGYNTSEGTVPNADFSRISSKGNFSYRFTPKLKISTGLLYANSGGSRIQRGSNISGVNLALYRTPPSFDNSNGFGDEGADNQEAYQFADGSQRSYRGGFVYDNPYWIVNNIPHNDETNRLLANLELNYLFTKAFSLTYRLGNDYYVDERTQGFRVGSSSFTSGLVFDDKVFNQDVNSDAILEYNRELIPQLTLNVLVGHNFYQTTRREIYAQGTDLSIPDFYDVSNAQTLLSSDLEHTIIRHGVYGDLQFNYRSLVYLNLTGRNDWSSTLPEDERSFFYPSVSSSFIFSELVGYDDILSFGKLRASYALVGNDAPAQRTTTPFAKVTQTEARSNTSDGWTNGIEFPAFGINSFTDSDERGNPLIKPEQTRSFEVGTDLRFLKDRLGLSFTYFNYLTEDQILEVEIPTSTGYEEQLVNAGKISNIGFEVGIDAVPYKSKDFTWEVGVTYYTYENIVEELAPGLENILLSGFTSTGSFVIEGEPFGVLRGGTWKRNDDGDIVIGDNGFPEASGMSERMGDPNPDFTGALRNTLTYKAFTLSALLDARIGGEMWNGTKGALTVFGRPEFTAEWRDRLVVFKGVTEITEKNAAGEDVVTGYETNEQEVAITQSWFSGNGGGFGEVDEQFVEDASSVRLRNVSLSYNFPKRYITGVKFISSASLTLSSTNLFVWTNFDAGEGFDPDINLTGGAGTSTMQNGRGLHYFGFPNVRTYSLALRLGF